MAENNGDGDPPPGFGCMECFNERKCKGDYLSHLPKILLMGLPGSGKTSIPTVVMLGMSPQTTFKLRIADNERVARTTINTYLRYQIWDVPGQREYFESLYEELDETKVDETKKTEALVFVVDIKNRRVMEDVMEKLLSTVKRMNVFRKLDEFDVFLHKVENMRENDLISIKTDIETRVNKTLVDGGYDDIKMRFHLTTIYNHSIYESLSKVLRELLPQRSTLEDVLDMLVERSAMEGAYFFDVCSNTCIATDRSNIEMEYFGLCYDFIETMINLNFLYGPKEIVKTFTSDCYNLTKLDDGRTFYLKQVNQILVLICIFQEDKCKYPGIIDHNIQAARKAILEILELRQKLQLDSEIWPVCNNRCVCAGSDEKSKTKEKTSDSTGTGTSSNSSLSNLLLLDD